MFSILAAAAMSSPARAADTCPCFTKALIINGCAFPKHSVGKYYRTGGGAKPARWRFFGVLTCGNARRPGGYATAYLKFEVQKRGFGRPAQARRCALTSVSRGTTPRTTASRALTEAEYQSCVDILKDAKQAVGAEKWR